MLLSTSSLKKIFPLTLSLFLGYLAFSPTAELPSVLAAAAQDPKYIPLHEGTPALRWDSTHTRANCPDDAKINEGSNDTRGSVIIPNFDLAHTDFA